MISPEDLARRLPDLIDELRDAGYAIGIEQYIAAQDLLLALAAEGALPLDPARYRTLLGPIFCKTEREQSNFETSFDRWIGGEWESPRRSTTQWLGRELSEVERGARLWNWFLLSGSVVAVLVGLLTLPGSETGNGAHAPAKNTPEEAGPATNEPGSKKTPTETGPRVETRGGPVVPTVPPRTPPETDRPITQDLTEKKSVKPPETRLPLPREELSASPNASLIERILRGQSRPPRDHPEELGTGAPESRGMPAAEPSSPAATSRVAALSWTLVLLTAGLFGVRFWWGRRARLFLERRATSEAPDLTRVSVKASVGELYKSFGIPRLAQRLRVRRPIASDRIDARATVLSTARNAGWFTPVAGSTLLVPEYLVLIDRSSPDDHQALFFDELIEHLVREEVIVARYEFDGDPRVCFRSGSLTEVTSIRSLALRHPADRLLILSSGEGLIHPLTGKIASWAEQFARWPERGLLTPRDFAHWGHTEWVLSEHGFLVFPATEEGLSALAASQGSGASLEIPSTAGSTGRFPELLRDRPRRWLEEREPQPELLTKLLAELKDYLGREGFEWLAACAVYPAIHWSLTVYLGYNLKTEEGLRLLDTERLPALARLPWFRQGSIPEWLRLALIRELPRDRDRAVRMALQALLLTASEGGAERFALEIAFARPNVLAPLAKRVFSALRSRAPEDSPLRDYVFASYMRGRKPSPLVLELPSATGGRVHIRANHLAPISLGIVTTAALSCLVFMPRDRERLTGHDHDDGLRVAAANVGAKKCMPCHNRKTPGPSSGILWNEYATWHTEDPHSTSYESLRTQHASRIVQNISLRSASVVPANKNISCLACHATAMPDLDAPATDKLREQGVSCESCHGNSTRWLAEHQGESWKSFDSNTKTQLGFNSMEDLSGRAQVCVGCHVGAPAADGLPRRQVDHELIMAGHPALKFELSTYLDNMSKHWDEKGRNAEHDFQARAWLLGRFVAAQAAIDLMRDRAQDPSARWPEFAEYDCFSCHHELRDETWRRDRASRSSVLGSPAWGTWYFALLETLAQQASVKGGEVFVTDLRNLRVSMNRLIPDRWRASAGADLVSQEIQSWLSGHADLSFNAHSVEKLSGDLSDPGLVMQLPSWDEQSQRYLALVRLSLAYEKLLPDQKEVLKVWTKRLEALRAKLAFPTGYDSPRGLEPRMLLEPR
jgi:outer membrane biosynthesis protein TonB